MSALVSTAEFGAMLVPLLSKGGRVDMVIVSSTRLLQKSRILPSFHPKKYALFGSFLEASSGVSLQIPLLSSYFLIPLH